MRTTPPIRPTVADASARNYTIELDRNLLDVACTPAMDRLTLIAVGAPSHLLPASPAAKARQARAG